MAHRENYIQCGRLNITSLQSSSPTTSFLLRLSSPRFSAVLLLLFSIRSHTKHYLIIWNCFWIAPAEGLTPTQLVPYRPRASRHAPKLALVNESHHLGQFQHHPIDLSEGCEVLNRAYF